MCLPSALKLVCTSFWVLFLIQVLGLFESAKLVSYVEYPLISGFNVSSNVGISIELNI